MIRSTLQSSAEPLERKDEGLRMFGIHTSKYDPKYDLKTTLRSSSSINPLRSNNFSKLIDSIHLVPHHRYF